MRFTKGKSGNPGGRPRGTSNTRAEELKAQLQKRGEKLLAWLDEQIDAKTLEPRDVIAILRLCVETRKDITTDTAPRTVINLGFITAADALTAKVMRQPAQVVLPGEVTR